MASAAAKYERKASPSYSDKHSPYYPALPAAEVCVYLVSLVVLHALAFYPLFEISNENTSKYLKNGDLEKGWYQGRYKDTTDFEWAFWNKYLWQVTMVGSAGHFVTARIADVACPKHRFKVFLIYGCAFTVHFLGWIGLALMLGHFVVQYVVTITTRSVAACWISAMLLMYSLDMEAVLHYMEQFYEDKDRALFLLFSTGMCGLRYLAFSIEYVWSSATPNPTPAAEEANAGVKQTKESHGLIRRRKKISGKKEQPHPSSADLSKKPLPNFLDLLTYQMYFPLLYGGPVMNYDEFSKQICQPPVTWTLEEAAKFVFGIIRYTFWHYFIDITFHYIYFSAMPYDLETVAKLNTWAFCGLALCQTYYFFTKYLVMYGVACHFSTSDNMAVDGIPHCCASKHAMTDMWRYFDKGLHRWLLRYVFFPLGGSRNVSIMRATFNSFLPFAFVWFWHGATRSLIVWACLNWFGVYMENIAYRIYKLKQMQDFEAMYLTPAWSRRIRGILSTVTYGLMITAGQWFPLDMEYASFFWGRFYSQDFSATVLMHLALYPAVQTSMEFRRMGVGF